MNADKKYKGSCLGFSSAFICVYLRLIVVSTAVAQPWQAADLNPVKLTELADQHPVTLVENGVAKAGIYVEKGVNVADAVKELQTCIKLASGVDLPVNDKLTSAPTIVISGRATPVTSETFVVSVEANHIVLTGSKDGGLAWGIYDFAERFIGARWYFPGDAGRFVPKSPSIAVPVVAYADRPVFPKRDIWPPVGDPGNGQGVNLMPLQTALRSADAWPHHLQVHTPDWSGIDDYRMHRPEVFQLTQAGYRDGSMLCYSNPRTITTYLEQIEKALAKDPSAKIGLVGDTITVCPNDAELACFCPDCKAQWDKSRGQWGSASRVVANFTAKLAAEVQKRWPKMTVLQLAYVNYTDAPTDVTFPENVEIQICGMPGMAMYKEPDVYAHEVANLDAWMKLTHGKKVQNWHYSCWPEDKTKAVFAYPHVVQKYYRENRDKLVGSFINGEFDHWPRQHLTLYCWMKVLWNPEFNVDAAIDAYCSNMYGAAAAEMRELVKLQIAGWENSRWPGGRLSSKNIYEISYPPATIERMKALLASAKAKTADDPTVKARLTYFAAPFDAMFQEANDIVHAPRRPVVAKFTSDPPKIDGKLDDSAWQSAEALPFVQGYDRDHPQVKYPTTLQAVWGDAGVTFAFRMTEPATAKLRTDRKGRDNSMLWWNDCVELLFDVTNKGEGEYYHIILSAAEVIADAKLKDYGWDCEGLKVATSIGSDHWSLEVFVPFAAFPEAVKPAHGGQAQWLGNFTRHRLADSGQSGAPADSTGEYQRLNTTFVVPTENLSDLVPIIFE